MTYGECNCGSVAFKINVEIKDVYMCHCSICRKSTGNNGVAVVVVSNDNFEWVKGEDNISYWKKDDVDWDTWFCKTCGSSLPGKNDPERMFVPAGLITEGGDQLKVAHHIFVDSKACWDEIGDNGKLHAEAFGG